MFKVIIRPFLVPKYCLHQLPISSISRGPLYTLSRFISSLNFSFDKATKFSSKYFRIWHNVTSLAWVFSFLLILYVGCKKGTVFISSISVTYESYRRLVEMTRKIRPTKNLLYSMFRASYAHHQNKSLSYNCNFSSR